MLSNKFNDYEKLKLKVKETMTKYPYFTPKDISSFLNINLSDIRIIIKKGNLSKFYDENKVPLKKYIDVIVKYHPEYTFTEVSNILNVQKDRVYYYYFLSNDKIIKSKEDMVSRKDRNISKIKDSIKNYCKTHHTVYPSYYDICQDTKIDITKVSYYCRQYNLMPSKTECVSHRNDIIKSYSIKNPDLSLVKVTKQLNLDPTVLNNFRF